MPSPHMSVLALRRPPSFSRSPPHRSRDLIPHLRRSRRHAERGTHDFGALFSHGLDGGHVGEVHLAHGLALEVLDGRRSLEGDAVVRRKHLLRLGEAQRGGAEEAGGARGGTNEAKGGEHGGRGGRREGCDGAGRRTTTTRRFLSLARRRCSRSQSPSDAMTSPMRRCSSGLAHARDPAFDALEPPAREEGCETRRARATTLHGRNL